MIPQNKPRNGDGNTGFPPFSGFMQTFTTIIFYPLFLLGVLLWLGLVLFMASQYVRFNFPTLFLTSGISLFVISFLPPARMWLSSFSTSGYALPVCLVSLGVFLGLQPAVIHYFEYRGFGPGAPLPRSLNTPGVLFTFDDGPSGQWTPEISSILARQQVSGIFFLVGTAVEQHPEQVRALQQAEQEVAVHSYSHRPLPFLFTRNIEEEIDRTITAIRDAGGPRPRFFRPPWGLYNREVLEIARSRGLETVLWSRSTRDWSGIPAGDISRNARENLKQGEIILFHDGHKEGLSREATARSLPEIIEEIRRQGADFARPEDVLKTGMGDNK